MTTTEESTHCLDCIEFQIKRYKEIAEFKKRYPHHCVDCGATGLYCRSYDGSTGQTDIEFCDYCLNRRKCPLCGLEMFSKKYLKGNFELFRCSECGWCDNGLASPDLPECICSVEEEVNNFPF